MSTLTDRDREHNIDALNGRLRDWLSRIHDQRVILEPILSSPRTTRPPKCVRELITEIEYLYRFPHVVGKRGVSNELGAIIRAVSRTPFKIVDNLALAMGMRKVDVVHYGILLCRDKTLRDNALAVYNKLNRFLNHEELDFYFSNSPKYLTMYESYFHPTLLSFISNRVWQITLDNWDSAWKRGTFKWLQRYIDHLDATMCILINNIKIRQSNMY
ncbi:Hypothetical protein FKW44_011864 [Caligus rogercresseyi]|uniref:Uncharacterized protein n=1 Tax=Caligus rogercresseyi TaxID=217165 RepID=A0A7T8HIW2_CALRO|nr:Hypothetical protein FKW44_011864 [Caligus rogercresseyi]